MSVPKDGAPAAGVSAEEVAAGRARVRQGYQMYLRKRAARRKAARLIGAELDRLCHAYAAALQGPEEGTGRDDALNALTKFAGKLRGHPNLMVVLRQLGPELEVSPQLLAVLKEEGDRQEQDERRDRGPDVPGDAKEEPHRRGDGQIRE